MTEPPTPDDRDRPVYLGGPPGVGIAVPAHVAGQLGLLPDDLSPAALADARRAARAELAVVQQRAEALDRARRYMQGAREQTAELELAVAEARAAGATWQQVADAVGITRQSAWKRWADGSEE